MPLNFALAGKKYAERTATIDADDIEAYARATGDIHPRYLAGETAIAPPVFPVVPAFPIMLEVAADPELGVSNPLKILHGAQEFRYHRALRAGETLTLRPVLEAVEDKGTGATFVVLVSSSDSGGHPVVDQWWTIFVRGGGTGGARERDVVETPPLGERVAEFRSVIAAEMPRRYAEASGDHNPIHLDEDMARAAGLPGVINHGLGTLAMVASGLVQEVAQADPERLRRLSARFTAPVTPGSELTTTVWTTAGEGRLLYESRRSDDRPALAGELETGAP